MKKNIAMAAVAMMFAACTNDEMPEVPAVDKLTDTPIMVNAGVADLVTRAGMTTDDLSDLGLFISNLSSDDAISSKYTFKNVEFEKDANGKFILVDSTIPLWQNETQKIQVQAYSPYNAAWTDLYAQYDIEVKTAQNVEGNVKASALLWAKAGVGPHPTVQDGDIKYNNGTLDITLEHVFSKLTVNVRFGSELTGISDVPDRGLTLNNFNTKGTFLLFDASVGNIPDTAAKIYAYKNTSAPNGYNSSFEAILLPQKSKFRVEIGLEGARNFAWESDSEFLFTPGRNYTLNLIVGKDKVEIADDGITVGEWKSSGTGDDLRTE